MRFLQLSVGSNGTFHCLFRGSFPRILHWPQEKLLIPSTARRFLGFICDSDRQAFLLPQDEKEKFAELREAVLGKKSVSLKTLQKLAGKTTSFALLVPAAKLYSNSMYQAISKASKTCFRQVKLSPTLRKEISHWRSLIAGKDACLGETSLTYRFSCFRMPLILDGVDVFFALVNLRL